jgi:hypothetical protein
MTLTAHAIQALQVWWKSVSNEGHFTREAATAFRAYLASDYCGVTETSHMSLTVQALQAVQVWSKSFRNEGHFTREAESFSSQYHLTLQWGN